jgi:hypothetical protein
MVLGMVEKLSPAMVRALRFAATPVEERNRRARYLGVPTFKALQARGLVSPPSPKVPGWRQTADYSTFRS